VSVLALKFTLLFDAFITSFGVFYRPYFTNSYHCCWNVWNKFYTIQIKLSQRFTVYVLPFFLSLSYGIVKGQYLSE
jgi:hypothetical protein